MQFVAVLCCPKQSFAVLCYAPLRSFAVFSHTVALLSMGATLIIKFRISVAHTDTNSIISVA